MVARYMSVARPCRRFIQSSTRIYDTALTPAILARLFRSRIAKSFQSYPQYSNNFRYLKQEAGSPRYADTNLPSTGENNGTRPYR